MTQISVCYITVLLLVINIVVNLIRLFMFTEMTKCLLQQNCRPINSLKSVV